MDQLKAETQRIGKPKWRAMLLYVAELHERSIHPPRAPFSYPWEEIGPGYCYGPAFGHWDLVHAILDTLPTEPEHARQQLLNNLAAQQEDGLVPGSIWMRGRIPMRGEQPRWSTRAGHPPVWPVAVQDHATVTGTNDLIRECYDPLIRQIGWFERQRRADDSPGFYYTDILDRTWESGIDEGVRFDDVGFTHPLACVDATAHVYQLYEFAASWSNLLSRDPAPYQRKAAELRAFIQNELFDHQSGAFYDIWAIQDPARRHLTFDGMWPMVVGAATPEQANRVIDEHLLNPDQFFTRHPICTVAWTDPGFELRMWRGPTWNSMTYWAARGCLGYDRPDAARRLVERAMDTSCAVFEHTETIWEFYHPYGGDPLELARKPHTQYNTPCREYLGHNPLIAMARLYDQTDQRGD